MHYSTMTSKGQITIPIAVREKFHLIAGSKIEFVPYGEFLMAIPINKSVTDLKGALPKPSKALSCEEMDDIIKGHYDRP